jgi:3-hydroxybutyryl-CoA dehydrogenase
MGTTYETVGVVGLGTMGAGIAEVFARAGLTVIGVEADPSALERGRSHLSRSTEKAVRRGELTADEREAILGRVTFAAELGALRDAGLVVEAIPEIMDAKRALFRELDRVCAPGTVLATNTSSLSVTAIAAATSRAERVVGMHFFNPAPVMRLVEVVRTVVTDDGVAEDVAELARRAGKTPVRVGDRAGFVVNRLLLGYLNRAVGLLERGVASQHDIETAMRLGAGLPMGPFALLDLIGLDTAQEICEALFHENRDPAFAPSPLLRELVAAGMLGRKTGHGFSAYTDEPPRVMPHTDQPAKLRISSVCVLGDGAEELRERLSSIGFRSGDPRASEVTIALTGVSVAATGARVPRPERLVGLHLVGDRLAEVVHAVRTAPEAAEAVSGLMRVLGRTPVSCADRAGRVVDALLHPYLNDAVRLYDSGYATMDEIDDAMRLGCGYPAGPFETLDALGLPAVRDGLRALYDEYREPFLAPAPLLDRLVTAGVSRFRV